MRPILTSDLSIDVVDRGDAVVVTLEGYGGFRQAQRLAEVLVRLVNRRPRRVVLDLSHTEFVSSVGTGVLLSFRHALGRIGCHVQVVEAPARAGHSVTACHTRT